MNPPCRLSVLVSLLFLYSSQIVVAQLSPLGSQPLYQTPGRFQPSIAVVIVIFGAMFTIVFLALMYAKFCQTYSRNHLEPHAFLMPQEPRLSGVDKNVIESLPFFRFSSLKGSREGLECAVCLSRFEDHEILRLLPKCKHAFHTGCIDRWLESHSSCPLCRFKVQVEDLTVFKYSTSSRFLFRDPSSRREDLDLELFVERERSGHHHPVSSRFNVGSSSRKIDKWKKEKKGVILLADGTGQDGRLLHKFKHKIIVSDAVFKNRWSDMNSSDLMSLNSEMLDMISGKRFISSLDSDSDRWLSEGGYGTGSMSKTDAERITKVKEELKKKKLLESKVSRINPVVPSTSGMKSNPRCAVTSKTRSMSEITNLPRFARSGGKINVVRGDSPSNYTRDEYVRRLWVPIARRTVQWFAGREKRPPQVQIASRQTLDV